MNDRDVFIIPFGKYKFQCITNIPDDYLLWLAKPKYSGKFYKSLHDTERTWSVPLAVKIAARQEADRRGWELKGETWDRK